jgi:hypothetical protein
MKTLLLLMLSLIMACSDKAVGPEVTDSPLAPMIKEANQIKEAMDNGRIFRFTSDRDRQIMNGMIRDARSALMALATDPNDERAILLGARVLAERDSLVITRSDQGTTSDFFERFYSIIHEAAKRNNIDLGDVDWRMYSTSFSTGVAPWGLFTNGTNWGTGISLDESYISAQGPSNKAWLISPSFDLSRVEKPSFRISHRTRIDRNDRLGDRFSRPLINQEVFRAYVSTNYTDGDPEEANWTRLDLGPMPAGVDFHNVLTSKIDLSRFRSTNTTVAFVFNADPTVVGSHWINWTIFRFELLGKGNKAPMTARASMLMEQGFTRNDLNGFHNLRFSEAAPSFEPFGFTANQIRFARIFTNGQAGDSWLISPTISLANIEQATLEIKERVNNPKFEKMQILISDSYQGGDPLAATWETIQRQNLPAIPDNTWTNVTSSNLNISRYLGRDVVVAFRFQPQASDNIAWQIETISLMGIGPRVTPKPYALNFVPPWQRDLNDIEVIKDIDFSKGLDGMRFETVSGSPARWDITTRNEDTYLVISGHSPSGNRVGTTRLVSQEFTLSNERNLVQIRQAMNFYDRPVADREKVKILLQRENGEEQALIFEQAPNGRSWAVISSERMELDEDLRNEKVRLILEYSSDSEDAPNWNVYWVRFYSLQL